MDDHRSIPWESAPSSAWRVLFYGILRSNGSTVQRSYLVTARDRRQAIQLAEGQARQDFTIPSFISATPDTPLDAA